MQVITKDRKTVCTTTAHYSPKEVKELKAAGYKVKEVDNGKSNIQGQSRNA